MCQKWNNSDIADVATATDVLMKINPVELLPDTIGGGGKKINKFSDLCQYTWLSIINECYKSGKVRMIEDGNQYDDDVVDSDMYHANECNSVNFCTWVQISGESLCTNGMGSLFLPR